MKIAVLALLVFLQPQEQPPPKSVPLDSVPAIYQTWYTDVARCVGVREGDFEEITWRLVPGAGWYDWSQGGFVWGLWSAPHTIYLASAYASQPWLVRHEMIHDLRGRGGHPSPPFHACEYAFVRPLTR